MTVDACRVCGSPCQTCAERRAAADLSAIIASLRAAASRRGPTVRMATDAAIEEMLATRKP